MDVCLELGDLFIKMSCPCLPNDRYVGVRSVRPYIAQRPNNVAPPL